MPGKAHLRFRADQSRPRAPGPEGQVRARRRQPDRGRPGRHRRTGRHPGAGRLPRREGHGGPPPHRPHRHRPDGTGQPRPPAEPAPPPRKTDVGRTPSSAAFDSDLSDRFAGRAFAGQPHSTRSNSTARRDVRPTPTSNHGNPASAQTSRGILDRMPKANNHPTALPASPSPSWQRAKGRG